MKKITTTIIALALSAFSLNVKSQCATITGLNVSYGAAGTVTISPIMTGSVGLIEIQTSIPPYLTSVPGPIALASLPNGTYTACMTTFMDSLSMCPPTTSCTVINVTTGPTSATCTADFYHVTDTNCITHFTDISTGLITSSVWNIDGVSYTSVPSLSYSPGIHTISLTNYSSGVMCDAHYLSTTITCPITVSTSTTCNSSFYMVPDSTSLPGSYIAINNSMGIAGLGLTYLWNFGDGTTSTLAYPTHTYSPAGHYIVCLTVSSGTACTDTYCDSSSVHRIASGFLMSSISVKSPYGATSIKEQRDLIGLNAYPNPMSDALTVELIAAENKIVNYSLIDALGRIVMSGIIENQKLNISTAHLDKGFYNLSITSQKGDMLKAVKLVK